MNTQKESYSCPPTPCDIAGPSDPDDSYAYEVSSMLGQDYYYDNARDSFLAGKRALFSTKYRLNRKIIRLI